MRLRFPIKWSEAELRKARDIAEGHYVAKHGGSTQAAFAELYREVEPIVDAALRATNDLLLLDAATLASERHLWQTIRFCCAPPISEENLWTFVGKIFKGPLPIGLEAKMAEVLASGLDLMRFPWLTNMRPPTADERRAAILSTSILIAQAQFTTRERGLAATRQEGLVHLALKGAGFLWNGEVLDVSQLEPGTFCGEKTIFNKKCDVPVRLLDERLLTLECKVSNTPKNSWKRLNQETIGKSATWRKEMNSGVVTGCVLAGVYDLQSLVQAQDQGIFIFWEHDLSSLVSFVADAK